MVARGHGNRASILPIRGWTDLEWDAAQAALRDRGWIDHEGRFTATGRAAREAIEVQTDEIAAEPLQRLGDPRFARFRDLMAPYARLMLASGVPGDWPPPHLRRPNP